MRPVEEQLGRQLDDAAQVCDLLRLAHSVAHNIQRDLHGASHEGMQELSQQLHEVRIEANRLFHSIRQDAEDMGISNGTVYVPAVSSNPLR
jgi:hypothetical protein